jgi:hypothetical protein
MDFEINPELVDEPDRKSNELPLPQIVQASGLTPEQVNPLIYEVFTDKHFVDALPSTIKNNVELLGAYLRNTSLFASIPQNHTTIRGDVIAHEPIMMQSGRERSKEEGEELLVDAVREMGIDPAYVFYYRRTQPSEVGTSKPEYYWTSDYWEVVKGLTQEISGEERNNSKILCTSLAELSSDSILSIDPNDDNGFSVRRASTDHYDQSRVLFVIDN